MIALTQEKREELIEKALLKREMLVHNGLNAMLNEIALASLTAEPAYYVFKHPNGKLFHSLVDESCKGHNDVHPVFTAPPVPEIKLPEKLGVGEIHYGLTEKYGFDVSIAQLERGLADEVYSMAVNNFERLNGLGE